MENKAGSWRGRIASNKCEVSFVFREQIRFFFKSLGIFGISPNLKGIFLYFTLLFKTKTHFILLPFHNLNTTFLSHCTNSMANCPSKQLATYSSLPCIP